MNLKNLENCFINANKQNKKYVGVLIGMYGFDYPEIIINPNENFNKKLDYYKNAYNYNLTLKNAPDKIKIIGFSYGDTLKDIENDLVKK
ncbi:MAG: hypothetical protein N4A54_10125 [Peptostreptococcaceae bacterium]|jgi:hypothetical protein|nr:hypothetical protein [Peptostreptococcaceae bacterium]